MSNLDRSRQLQNGIKRTSWLILAIIGLTLILPVAAVLADDISGARWSGTVRISSNSSVATDNIVVTMDLPEVDFLVNQGFSDNSSDFSVRNDAGASMTFSPSINGTVPWSIYAPQVAAHANLDYRLYTGNVSGGDIAIFPGTDGVVVSDAVNMEPPTANYSIELYGLFDTTYNSANKTYLNKAGAVVISNTADGTIEAGQTIPGEGAHYLSYDNNNDKAYKNASVVSAGAGNTISIEAWIYKDSSNTDDTILSCGPISGGNDYYLFFQNTSGNFQFLMNDSVGGALANFTSTNSTSNGVWYFVTLRYDNAAAPEVRLMVNGAIWGGSDSAGGGAIVTPNTYLATGMRWNGATWGNPFAGDIDEVRLSDNARTLSEHQAIYNGGTGVSMGIDGSTVSLWLFNEGAGNPQDSAGNNDLTLDGATWTDGGITLPILTASDIATGEHTLRLWADGSYWHLSIDGVETDNLSGGNIPDTANDWIISYNATMPYFYRFIESVGGLERCRIEWERAETLTDLSGNGNDATPSYRLAGSNALVTAELLTFEPSAQARAPNSAVDLSGTIINDLPDQPSTLYTDTANATPGFFYAGLVNALLDAGTVPRPLFWYPWGMLHILLAGAITYHVTKQLLTQFAVMLGLMIFFAMPGLNIWGIWLPIFFAIEGLAVIIMSKHFSWA